MKRQHKNPQPYPTQDTITIPVLKVKWFKDKPRSIRDFERELENRILETQEMLLHVRMIRQFEAKDRKDEKET